MKLRTEMKVFRDGKTTPVAPDASKAFFMHEHDAAAAHALMQALIEYSIPRMVIERASELLREWGFDSGEAE